MPRARKSTFDDPYIEIIKRLVAERRRLGLSQAEVGMALGEDQPFVSRIERRQRKLDVWEFVQFCRVLNVQPEIVLDGIGRE